MSQRETGPPTARVSGVAQATALTAAAPSPRSLVGQWVAGGLILVAAAVAAGVLGSQRVAERVDEAFNVLYEGWNQQQRSLDDVATRLGSVQQRLEQWAALDETARTGDASGVLVVSREQVGELTGQLRGVLSQADSLRRLAVQRQSLAGQASAELRRDAMATLWASVVGLFAAGVLAGIWLGRATIRPLGRLRRDLELADQSAQALASALSPWFGRAAEAVKAGLLRMRDHEADVATLRERLGRVVEAAAGLAAHARTLVETSDAFGAVADRVRDLGDESKLLALSASIEAARMDDRGRSIGVVAEEIRRLAGDSRQVVGELARLKRQIGQAAEGAQQASRVASTEAAALQEALDGAVRSAQELIGEFQRVQERLQAASRAAAGFQRSAAVRGTYELRASVDRALGSALAAQDGLPGRSASPGGEHGGPGLSGEQGAPQPALRPGQAASAEEPGPASPPLAG